MASSPQTVTFTSNIDSEGKMSYEPTPAYTAETDLSGSPTKDEKPKSVFTLNHTPNGNFELTSNRKLIRVTIEHKYNKDAQPSGWQSSTTVKADIIPTNSDVLKQVVQDVYNSQTQTVLHAPKVWKETDEKAEVEGKTEKTKAEKKKRSWWPFKKSKGA